LSWHASPHPCAHSPADALHRYPLSLHNRNLGQRQDCCLGSQPACYAHCTSLRGRTGVIIRILMTGICAKECTVRHIGCGVGGSVHLPLQRPYHTCCTYTVLAGRGGWVGHLRVRLYTGLSVPGQLSTDTLDCSSWHLLYGSTQKIGVQRKHHFCMI
jgi:hypothetical protein